MFISLLGPSSNWLKVILWCSRVSTHHYSSISQLLLYECNQSGSLSPDSHTKRARQHLCGWKGILVKHQEPRCFIMDSKLVWALLQREMPSFIKRQSSILQGQETLFLFSVVIYSTSGHQLLAKWSRARVVSASHSKICRNMRSLLSMVSYHRSNMLL